MKREWTSFGKRAARALIALLVTLIAFGRPLDAAAHAAGQEVEAGNPSPFLKFIAAFDVIDDAFDHQTGSAPGEKSQIVLQVALPEPGVTGISTIAASVVEHAPRFYEALTTRSPPPLDRPPRT